MTEAARGYYATDLAGWVRWRLSVGVARRPRSCWWIGCQASFVAPAQLLWCPIPLPMQKGVQCQCGSPFAVWRGRPERGRFDHVDMADVLHSMGGRGAAVRLPICAERDQPSPLRAGFARWV
jgi:hypothetical protein